MSESIKKYDTGYTQVLNKVLLDENLSLKAKGLYAYLFSKPDGWQFHIACMEKELKESKGQIRTIIKELINFGYIERKQVNENGVFGGIIYEFIKQDDEKKPCAEKCVYGETLTHNNIYSLNKTYDKNIYMSDFEEFWKYYPKQRAGSKTKAYSSYCRVIKEKRSTVEKLLASVKRYAISEEVKRGFAKGCSAWLNDDRFNNEYTSTADNYSSDVDAFVAQWERSRK